MPWHVACLQPWSPGLVVGSEGLSRPSKSLFIGAFSVVLDVVSEDPSWSSDSVVLDLPSPVLLPGASTMVFPGARALVVYAKDSDTFEVLANFPHQQLVKEGEEVSSSTKLSPVQ